MGIYAELQDCFNILEKTKEFAGITHEDPLPVSVNDRTAGGLNSGIIAAYDKDQYMSTMNLHGEYVCGINLFWTALFYTAMPGVPLVKSSIAKCAEKYFPGDTPPAKFPCMVSVGVSPDDKPPCQAKGFLKRLSPEEVVYALVIKIATACKAGAWDAATRQKWRRLILTVPAEFIKVTNHAEYRWKAKAIRERIGMDFELLYPNTIQKITDLVLFKKDMEAKTGQTVAAGDLYKLHVENLGANMAFSSSDSKHMSPDAFTKTWVDTALTVWEGLLKHPELHSTFLSLQEQFGRGNPWDSVYKMEWLARKAGRHRSPAKASCFAAPRYRTRRCA